MLLSKVVYFIEPQSYSRGVSPAGYYMVVSPFTALDNHHILLHIQDVAMVTVLGRKMTISVLPEHELIRLNTFFWICS